MDIFHNCMCQQWHQGQNCCGCCFIPKCPPPPPAHQNWRESFLVDRGFGIVNLDQGFAYGHSHGYGAPVGTFEEIRHYQHQHQPFDLSRKHENGSPSSTTITSPHSQQLKRALEDEPEFLIAAPIYGFPMNMNKERKIIQGKRRVLSITNGASHQMPKPPTTTYSSSPTSGENVQSHLPDNYSKNVIIVSCGIGVDDHFERSLDPETWRQLKQRFSALSHRDGNGNVSGDSETDSGVCCSAAQISYDSIEEHFEKSLGPATWEKVLKTQKEAGAATVNP